MKSASNLVLSLKMMVAKESIQELKFNPGSTVVFHELQYRLALCILCTKLVLILMKVHCV